MSYTEEENKQADDELETTARKQGLRIKYVNLDKKSIPLYVYLIALGLIITGVCAFVHGV